MNRKKVKEIKALYKKGDTLRLTKDLIDLGKVRYKAGTTCIVNHVDDIGTIFPTWEDGGGLGIVPEEDEFEKISEVKNDEE